MSTRTGSSEYPSLPLSLTKLLNPIENGAIENFSQATTSVDNQFNLIITTPSDDHISWRKMGASEFITKHILPSHLTSKGESNLVWGGGASTNQTLAELLAQNFYDKIFTLTSPIAVNQFISGSTNESQKYDAIHLEKAATQFQEISNFLSIDDESIEAQKFDSIENFILRFEDIAFSLIRRFILDSDISASQKNSLLLPLTRLAIRDFRDAIGNILELALNSEQASTRYSAAIAFGELADSEAREALKNRLAIEKNSDVSKMIKAQLQ